jgi:hypothetical protein
VSALAGPSYLARQVARSSASQRWLRAAGFAAALTFLAVVWVAGEHHPVLTAVGVAVAGQAALAPGSDAPLALVLYLGGLWFVATPGRLDLGTLVAGVALTLTHLACAVVAHGPPGLSLDRGVLRLWAARAPACAAGGLGVWLAGRAAAAVHPSPGGAPPAAALVLVLAWCVLVAARVRRRRPPAD